MLQDIIRGFDSAPPSCHAPKPSYFCIRIPTRDPRLYRQICCNISGRRHVLLGGNLMHKLDQVVATEDTSCRTWRVLWTWMSDSRCIWMRLCRTHRPLSTPPCLQLIQFLIQRPTYLQRSCNELVRPWWQMQGTRGKVKEGRVKHAWCVRLLHHCQGCGSS